MTIPPNIKLAGKKGRGREKGRQEERENGRERKKGKGEWKKGIGKGKVRESLIFFPRGRGMENGGRLDFFSLPT